MYGDATLRWLAGTRLARRVVDRVYAARARRRLVELDRLSTARCQMRTLLGLLNQAQATRFGRDHDFPRLRTADDYRRLVPLRRAADLWRDYWQPAFPNLANVTWPGPIPYLAVSALEAEGPARYVPVSPGLWASHRTAAATALAYLVHARPRARFLAGQVLCLGRGGSLAPLGDGVLAGSLEGIARHELPATLRPCVWPERPVEESAQTPITCIIGEAGSLATYFAQVLAVTGRDHVVDVWPNLAAIVYTRGPADMGSAQLIRCLGAEPATPVLLLEACFRPEGAVAVEDPRHGLLRLIPDHGVYFEFVPVEQLGQRQPERHGAAEVEPGVAYALAVTSAAGFWSCLTGVTVCFERCDPPLFRLVEASVASPRIGAHPFPIQPPHPRAGDDAPLSRKRPISGRPA